MRSLSGRGVPADRHVDQHHGYYYESYAAGGGSGFLSFYSQSVRPGVTDLTVTVGAQAQASSLSANGELLVRAGHGQHGWIDIAGGNGYSGGGDAFPHPSAGGSDGSDGFGDGQEGRGTGEDITSFPFTNFLLTPGAGGARSGGGGGGGVLVDGEGPHRHHQGTGEGYGGGGEGSRQTTEFTFEGLQGVVLIELTSK